MLKGIDPLLSPELVKLMMEMGHDDALILADANFTAHRLAGGKQVIRMPGVSLVQAVKAITSLFPLVADEVHPVGYMRVSGEKEDYRSAVQREAMDILEPLFIAGQSAEAIERFAFYERTKAAFAIVVTGEKQPFANFLLRKGVICENLRP
jgi:L-fucose mutarotase